MLFSNLKLLKSIKPISKIFIQNFRTPRLWYFVDVAFNRVDQQRLTAVGPDRCCAEWILKNGGTVKFREYPSVINNYNALPNELHQLNLTEITVNDIALLDIGFDHLLNCKNLKKIIIRRCGNVNDKSLAKLCHVRDTLNHLEISSCSKVTTTGLLTLKCLQNLKTLDIINVSKTHSLPEVQKRLEIYLPHCQIKC